MNRWNFLGRGILFSLIFLFLSGSWLQGTEGEVVEEILPNGLRVILKEVHTSPLVSVWSWYDVGSRDEGPGVTGLAHFLEHMNFKGTEGISREEMKSLIDALGGYWNGYTWLDQTTYYETLPSAGLDLALELEAERMCRSLLDPAEMEKERTVVISELQGGESDPRSVLDIEVTAAAFKAHPYGWPTIGWLSDLETISSADLTEFYRTYYVPNNAVLVVVGDFESASVMEKVRRLFQEIPVGPAPPEIRTLEPEQFGERRVLVRKAGPTEYLQVVYHTPPVSHADFLPLLVLDAVLAGGESINLSNLDWDEEASRSSRLYRALIDKGLASSAGANLIPTRHPCLFSLYATAREGVGRERLEEALLTEVGKLGQETLGAEELERAKAQLLARFVYDGDSVTEQAHQLGFFATIHDYRYPILFPTALEGVTASQVREAARKYLTPDNRTVGWFIPSGEDRSAAGGAGPAASRKGSRISMLRSGRMSSVRTDGISGFPLPDFSRVVPVRKVLGNGLVVQALRNPIGPSIHMAVTVRAGSAAEPPGKGGLATLAVRYLQEGAGELSGEALGWRLDAGGTQIGLEADYDYASIDLDLLARNFDEVAGLLADILMRPSFPEGAMDRLKGEMTTEIREEEEDEFNSSILALRELIYTPDHPYGKRVLGTKEGVERLTSGDVRDFYRRCYYPANTSIVVVGDIDPSLAIRRIEALFGDWEGPPGPVLYDIPPVERQEKGITRAVSMPEKTQVSLAMGHLGIRRDEPDYILIQVMNNILGQFGIGGRLGEQVREEMGHAYFVYSVYEGGFGPYPFLVMAGVAPGVVGETVGAIREEIRKMAEGSVTAEELENTRRNILGSLALALEENEGIAGILSEMELYSLGTDHLEKFSREVGSVTLEEVQNAARRYLDPERCSLALAGPIDESWNSFVPDENGTTGGSR